MTKIEQLLSVIDNDLVYIQTHNYPDQDALATAHGLKLLLEHYGKKAIVCYKGAIDKANTLQMISLLQLDIVPADTIEFSASDETILVDCQQGNSNVKSYCGTVIACIDHHKEQETSNYRFHDIRPECGACASIIASYYLESDIPISKLLATTFTYAIRMDTNCLNRHVSDLDLKLYSTLYKKSDIGILSQLDSCTMKLQDLQIYYHAIENLRFCHTMALLDLGDDCSEAIMGQISDFMLTLEEVDIIVSHSFRDNGIKFTVRSSCKDLDASEVVRAALNELGDGGGHPSMAAGFIPGINNPSAAHTVSKVAEKQAITFVCNAMHWNDKIYSKRKQIVR